MLHAVLFEQARQALADFEEADRLGRIDERLDAGWRIIDNVRQVVHAVSTSGRWVVLVIPEPDKVRLFGTFATDVSAVEWIAENLEPGTRASVLPLETWFEPGPEPVTRLEAS